MQGISEKAIQKALKIAENVFKDFMNEVVNTRVAADRVGSLSEKDRKNIESQNRIDNRAIHLLSISGKGNIGHPEYENVTLLDHLLSVARGSMLLAIMDDVTEFEDEDVPILKRQLAITVTTAFLHDVDKDLELKINTELTESMMADKMSQYGIDSWLKKYGVELTPSQMLCLIGLVEDSQHFRYVPDHPLPRESVWAKRYVGVADKLDGAWLHKDGGYEGVINRLQKDVRIKNPIVRQWRIPPIDIFDPHHPFLLDELQRALSWRSSQLLGIPPLVEIHKDGRLLVVLPERGKPTDLVIDEAFKVFADRLPGGLRLQIETMGSKGVPKLLGGQPRYEELVNFLNGLLDQDLVKIFYVKKSTQEIVENELDEALDDIGLPLKWSEGNICLPFTDLEDVYPRAREQLQYAATAALLMNLADKPDTRKRRWVEFTSIFKDQKPSWLDDIEDEQSRRTLSALWTIVNFDEGDPEFAAIWGEEGLLRHWWEGDESYSGLRFGLEDRGSERIDAVVAHYRSLISGRRVIAEDENASGRCIVTDRPVPHKDTIRSEDRLYGLKISAFSGRDGRPEDLNRAVGHTNVGPVSALEFQLRSEAHARTTAREGDVPTLISTPTTSGLFGGFAVDNQRLLQDISIYQLATLEIKKGAISFGLNHYAERVRVARFEKLAERTADQIRQLYLLMKASLRMGRPFHIFRGLSTHQRSFFFYDAMPKFLAELIGGNELRLEQIPKALRTLELAEVILKTNGLGFDVLRSFASSRGRLGALCLTWCRLRDDEKEYGKQNDLRDRISMELKEENVSERDGAFIRFAQAASTIQKKSYDSKSHNEQLMVFNLAFEAVANAKRMGQTDKQSLIYAVAGSLEENLARKDLAASKKWRNNKSLTEGCKETAELFVNEVWIEALNGHIPPQSVKSTLAAIYRVALLDIFRSRVEDQSDKQTAP